MSMLRFKELGGISWAKKRKEGAKKEAGGDKGQGYSQAEGAALHRSGGKRD